MKKVAIVQSNYIPWKGYFDMIKSVDEFILYDDAQYTKRDWRNRNVIKTPVGSLWLSIPIHVKGKFEQRICDAYVADQSWRKKHWKSLQGSYAKAPHFSDYFDTFEALYLDSKTSSLSEINKEFLQAVCAILQIDTKITFSMDYGAAGNEKTEKLLNLCKAADAQSYVTGPAARDYFDESLFAAAGVAVEWFQYGPYPEYQQLYPPFTHNVSILDLLFSVGADAHTYIGASS